MDDENESLSIHSNISKVFSNYEEVNKNDNPPPPDTQRSNETDYEEYQIDKWTLIKLNWNNLMIERKRIKTHEEVEREILETEKEIIKEKLEVRKKYSELFALKNIE